MLWESFSQIAHLHSHPTLVPFLSLPSFSPSPFRSGWLVIMLFSQFVLAALGILFNITTASSEQVKFTVDSQPDRESITYLPRYNEASRLYTTRYEGVTWDNENWALSTTDLRPHDFRASAFTANGYIGISMASNGPFPHVFAESSGWPLFDQRLTFATVSGFFNRQPTTNGTNFAWLEVSIRNTQSLTSHRSLFFV